MLGCRPLTDIEIQLVMERLNNPRDKCLFILGIATGYRITELLSIQVQDVLHNRTIVERLDIRRANVKGKVSGQSVALRLEAKQAIADLIAHDGLDIGEYLFKSRKGLNKPIDRMRAWRILKDAVEALGLGGKIATHSMRKTFAKRVYNKLGKDLLKTRKAMRHKDINSTIAYLEFDQTEIDAAILSD